MIRKANPNDANAVAPLIYIVLQDMELDLIQQVSDEKWLDVLAKAFKTDDYRYSYNNAFVYEQEGKVAGVAFGYLEEKEDQIDEALGEFLDELGLPQDAHLFNDKEAYKNEWYLDTLAVSPAFQGHGVGTALLEALPEFVAQQGVQLLGLNVDQANVRAEKLYHKMGYRKVGELKLGTHPYNHMQYRIEG